MTAFDELSFQQRAYVIQRITVLVERLKELNFRDELGRAGTLDFFGESIEVVEAQLLACVLTHFTSEDEDDADEDEEYASLRRALGDQL